MKDIKSYIIGFLTCACLFLIMGQTRYDAIGRYQLAVDSNNNEITYYVFDTELTWVKSLKEIKRDDGSKYWQRNIVFEGYSMFKDFYEEIKNN